MIKHFLHLHPFFMSEQKEPEKDVPASSDPDVDAVPSAFCVPSSEVPSTDAAASHAAASPAAAAAVGDHEEDDEVLACEVHQEDESAAASPLLQYSHTKRRACFKAEDIVQPILYQIEREHSSLYASNHLHMFSNMCLFFVMLVAFVTTVVWVKMSSDNRCRHTHL